MKRFQLKFVILILLLPILLSACGGDKVGNAEKFLEALSDGDIDEAKKYVCDDQKDELEDEDSFAAFLEGVNISDISCEEDGDNVKCSMKVSLEGFEDSASDTEVVFVMDGDKVCGGVE